MDSSVNARRLISNITAVLEFGLQFQAKRNCKPHRSISSAHNVRQTRILELQRSSAFCLTNLFYSSCGTV